MISPTMFERMAIGLHRRRATGWPWVDCVEAYRTDKIKDAQSALAAVPELEALIEAAMAKTAWTRLQADPGEDGWRIHDMPNDSVWAILICEGLEEAEAKWLTGIVNAAIALGRANRESA